MFRRVAYPRLLGLTPLRYQLVDIPLKLHHPMWVENADIDLDYHLRQTLRRLLLRYDGKADAPLIAGVPVSVNPSPDRLVGNEFTYMTPSLPVHIDDPLERVRLTSLSTSIAKENHQLLGPMVLPAWMSYLPPSLAPGLFRRQARRVESASVMNLVISNSPTTSPSTTRVRRPTR
jgi:hypothetical protein